MAAFTEQGADANAVGRGRGRGCGTNTGAKVREPWVRPNLPYTKEQCKKILGGYHTRELCSKCGNTKRRARSISFLMANQHAKSASAPVTMTRIVLPIGKHSPRLARYLKQVSTMLYLKQVSTMLTMLASRLTYCLTFQMLSLIPRMPRQCLQPEVSSNAIDHQKTPRHQRYFYSSKR
jgi:hypothetical protein